MSVDTTTALGTLITAAIGSALWLRKLKPVLAKDDLATKAAEADIGVIERLERECKRMSEQNDKLADSLGRFQLQIITFQTENQKLSLENNSLKEENLSLREEIMDLRKEVAELTQMVMKVQTMAPECMHCPHKGFAKKPI